MRNLKYSFLLLVLVSFVSCDEDRFTSVKTIDFPEHTPLLAVTSNLSVPDPDDNFSNHLTAFVGHSLGILDEEEYDVIDQATVELFKDGTKLFDLIYNENNNNYFGPDNFELTQGEYLMEVSAPGYDKVSATQTMPSQAEIVSSSYDFEAVPFDIDSDLYDLFKVKIKDREDEENFYAFDLKFEVMNSQGELRMEHAYYDSDDPLLEYGAQLGYILPDITFNGGTYDLRLLQQSKWFLQNGDEIKNVILDVFTITKDLYFYDTSREKYWNAQDNPFAEPVLIHSNFEGGYGVFTLANRVRYVHEL